jgi:Tol biopolymer transport system component
MLLDLKDNKSIVLAMAHDAVEDTAFTPEGSQALNKIGGKLNVRLAPPAPAIIRINSVLPAPDDFRLLYSIKRGKFSELWAVMPDGTKASRLYKSEGDIRQINWTPEGQQVVFEENEPGSLHFFRNSVHNIQVLDVNVGTHTTLILPQVEHRSPAVSPDGAKIAFLGSAGLWYPSLTSRSTLWVSAVR